MERYAGRFARLKTLGKGGMGEVFLAVDLDTKAEVAIKRLTVETTGAIAETLRAEFEALSRVRHPVIVQVLEFGVDFEDRPFLVMEYVPGWTVDRVVRRGDARALAIVGARLAEGLAALHGAGVFHGDLKPENVIAGALDQHGVPRDVRLVDFGLAAIAGKIIQGHRGTPGYTAPEVVAGSPAGPAADLYALGSTLYALAAGRPPFESPDVGTTLELQRGGPPSALPLEESGVPGSWIRLILRLMAPAAPERPGSAVEVRRSIEQIAPEARIPIAERLAAQSFAGRERELARIERLWRRAASGSRTLLITGESGIGKSALLDAFAFRGALDGRVVLRISGATGGGPAGAWRSMLRRVAAEARFEWRELPAEERREFEDGPQEPDDMTITRGSSRAVEWLRAIAARSGPPCVLLDDADSLDPASLRALRRVMLAAESAPALWVLARRLDRGVLPEDEQVLVRVGAWERLSLEPLDRAGVARVAATRLSAESPAELTEFLWNRGAGHAGLTVEALRAAAEAGAIREDDLGLHVDASLLERLPLLADFESARLQRLAMLPEDSRVAARALAIRGVPIPMSSVARVAGIAAEPALQSLRDEGLAAEGPDGRWQLTPPAIGARVQADCSSDERRAIHSAILESERLSDAERFHHRRELGDRAGALTAAEDAFSAEPSPTLADEAAALAELDDPSLAAKWLQRAARAWMDRGRYATAEPRLVRALELDATSADRPARWGLLCTCRHRLRDMEGLERAVREALQEPLDEAGRADILMNDAARLLTLQRHLDALTVGEEAARLARRSRNYSALAAVHLTVGSAHLYLGQLTEAMRHADSSIETARQLPGSLAGFRAVVLKAMVLWSTARPADAEVLLQETLEEVHRLNARLAIEELLLTLAGVQVSLGRWRSAVEHYRHALRIGLEDGRPRQLTMLAANLAVILSLMGELQEARRTARRAGRLARRYSPQLSGLVEHAWAFVCLSAGRLTAAERCSERAINISQFKLGTEERAWSVIALARALARRHRWKDAHAVVEPVVRGSASVGTVGDIALAALYARAHLRSGNVDAAKQQLARIEAWRLATTATYGDAMRLQLRAELRIAARSPEEAVLEAEKALKRFAALPAAPDEALANLEFARLALEHGLERPEAVLRWLDSAISTFERLGDGFGRREALMLKIRCLNSRTAERGDDSRERDLLDAVRRLIDSMSDFGELVERAMKLVVEQLRAERGLLLLRNPETRELEAVAEHGTLDAAAKRQATEISQQAVRRATESRGSVLIQQDSQASTVRTPSMHQLGVQSVLCVPLFRNKAFVGAVYLDDSRPNAFRRGDEQLLRDFADLIVIAIENSRDTENVRRVNEQLVGENVSLRLEMESRFNPSGVIGRSLAMRRVMAVVERAAQVRASVLITGESGTGKEKIARVLHYAGPRRDGPFVAVNCGALPEGLLESELFGHVRGAFSNALTDRAGAFETASGGTLFLDEIGEMPQPQQVKLLRALANGEVTRLGSSKPIHVDVRIIAATNRDLRQLLVEAKFREDLFYRLNVLPIELPPLRERKADIPMLAKHFVEHFARIEGQPAPKLSSELLSAMMRSDWPGNVRELQNYVERLMAMQSSPELIPIPPPPGLEQNLQTIAPGGTLSMQLAEFEKRVLRDALAENDGNQTQAAQTLGMKEATLRYRLAKHGLVASRKLLRIRKNMRVEE